MQLAVRTSTAESVPIVDILKQLAGEGRFLAPKVPASEIVAYLEADGHPRFSEQRFVLS